MRRVFTAVIAVFAVVAFASMVSAQTAAPQTAAPAKTAKVEKAAEQKAPAKVAEKAAAGKVAKYDEATKTLTVTPVKGADQAFVLGADAKIMVGAKAATAADLVAGKAVKVTYTEAEGKMTATKIQNRGREGCPGEGRGEEGREEVGEPRRERHAREGSAVSVARRQSPTDGPRTNSFLGWTVRRPLTWGAAG